MRGRHSKRKRTPQKGEARQAALVPRAFWNCHRRGFRPVALKYFSTVADSLPRTRTHPDHRASHCLLFNRAHLFRPVYYGSARYCLSASVSFTIVINHSRNHWRGDSRSWWEREREFRWEKRTTRCNDRTAILRVSLSAGSFSPFLFFFFFTRAVSSMHVFTVPFFEDFNPAAIQPLIWDSISFEFLFVFNTVRYIRVGAMGNCEQSISPLLLFINFIKFSNIITFFFLRYLKVKCIWYASNYQLRLN